MSYDYYIPFIFSRTTIYLNTGSDLKGNFFAKKLSFSERKQSSDQHFIHLSSLEISREGENSSSCIAMKFLSRQKSSKPIMGASSSPKRGTLVISYNSAGELSSKPLEEIKVSRANQNVRFRINCLKISHQDFF